VYVFVRTKERKLFLFRERESKRVEK